ncbi:lipoprotein LpqV [Mycolicibacterium thermoresistibile]
MRSHPIRATVTAAAVAVVLAGCSSEADDTAEPSPAPAEPTTTSPQPGAIEVSPGGVTTAMAIPAESTENEYFRACITARQWMEEQEGELKDQVEPYLAMLQNSDEAGPSTFNTPWSQLPPGRQAAVIVAVEAAADELCG